MHICIKVDDSVDDDDNCSGGAAMIIPTNHCSYRNNSPHGSRKDVHDKMLRTMLETSLQPNKVIVCLRLIN